MALSAGTISATELNTEFSANTAAITTNVAAGRKDWQVDLEVASLASSTVIGRRCVHVTMPDDCELRYLGFSGYGNGVGDASVTLTLTCIDSSRADTDTSLTLTYPLLEKTVALTGTIATNAAVETTIARADYTATTGDRHVLRKGNTYRLAFSTTSSDALTRVFGFALVRGWRRIA